LFNSLVAENQLLQEIVQLFSCRKAPLVIRLFKSLVSLVWITKASSLAWLRNLFQPCSIGNRNSLLTALREWLGVKVWKVILKLLPIACTCFSSSEAWARINEATLTTSKHFEKKSM
jgi:hypothetical protein